MVTLPALIPRPQTHVKHWAELLYVTSPEPVSCKITTTLHQEGVGVPTRYAVETARASAKRTGAEGSIRYHDGQLTITVKTRTVEASQEWLGRITGRLLAGHGPANASAITGAEPDAGDEPDEAAAARKLDEHARRFEEARKGNAHGEVYAAGEIWTGALHTAEVQIGTKRLPNGVTKPITAAIDSTACSQLEATVRERMLFIVRTARRGDANDAAQLLAAMTRGDRDRETALFDAIAARDRTRRTDSDYDKGAITLTALEALITKHDVDEKARERAFTAIRQLGAGPVKSKSARDRLMWQVRRLIENDGANPRAGAGLVLRGLEAGLAELAEQTVDLMLAGDHARTMRIYALRHLAKCEPETGVRFWTIAVEELMIVTGPGTDAAKYATLSRHPVTFEAREALWFLEALKGLATIPQGGRTEPLHTLVERLKTRMGGLTKEERARVVDQIKLRIDGLEDQLAART